MSSPVYPDSSNQNTLNKNSSQIPFYQHPTYGVVYKQAIENNETSTPPSFKPITRTVKPYQSNGYREIIIDAKDNADGIFFSHFMNVLYSKIDDFLKSTKDHFHFNTSSYLFNKLLKDNQEEYYKNDFYQETSCYHLIEIIQNETKKYYKDDDILIFLAGFQSCIYLPIEHQDPVFNALKKDFKFTSFKNQSPILELLYNLAIVKNKPFKFINAVLNMIAWMHEKMVSSEKEELSVTFKERNRLECLSPSKTAAFHFNIKTKALTLEIPYDVNKSLDAFTYYSEFIRLTENILPCLPKFENEELDLTEHSLTNDEKAICSKFKNISERLIKSHSLNATLLGIKLLFACSQQNKILLEDSGTDLLKAIPKLKRTTLDIKEKNSLILNLKKLNSQLLTEKSFDEIFFGIKFSTNHEFLKMYIKELLNQKETYIQKIAFDLWEQELFSSVIEESYEDLIQFANEMYEIIAKEPVNHETLSYALRTLKNVYKKKLASKKIILSCFAKLFSKANSSSYLTFYETATHFIDKPYKTSLQNSEFQSTLIPILSEMINQKENKLAFNFLITALNGNWLDFKDEKIHTLAVTICKDSLQEPEVALDYYLAFLKKRVFGLKLRDSEYELLLTLFKNSSEQNPKKNQLLTQLFEYPLPKYILSQYRLDFIAYLNDLNTLGLETMVARILKSQPHDLTKNELNEIHLTAANYQTNEKEKIKTLLTIDKNCLNQDSLEAYTNRCIELINSLLEKQEVELAIVLTSKMLPNRPEFLQTFFQLVLKKDVASYKTEMQLILETILSNSTISLEDKILIFNASVDILKPLSKTLLDQIKELHLGLHDDLNVKNLLTLPLLQKLLEFFKPEDLLHKSPKILRETLSILDIEKNYVAQSINLKEQFLNAVLNHKKDFVLEDEKRIFQNMILELLDLNKYDSALSFALQLDKVNLLRWDSEIEISNLYACFDAALNKNDDLTSLFFLRKLKRNEEQIQDVRFIERVKTYSHYLLQKEKHFEWALFTLEFNQLNATIKDQTMCTLVVAHFLTKPVSKEVVEVIFDLLQKTVHLSPSLWNMFFNKVKNLNHHALKVKICNLLKDDLPFISIWEKDMALHDTTTLYLLEFLNAVKNTEADYFFFKAQAQNIMKLIDANAKDSDLAFKQILPLLNRLFKIFKNNTPEKKDLILKIFLNTDYPTFKNKDNEWNFFKLLFSHCRGETHPYLMIVNSFCLSQVVNDPDFKSKKHELIEPLKELLNKWPKDNFEQYDFISQSTLLKTNSTISIFNKTEVLLSSISEIAYVLFQSKGVFFEQYENLIQNESEDFQLIALKLYAISLYNLENEGIKNISLNTTTCNMRNNELLMLAFESKYSSVIKEALPIFNTDIFKKSLKKHSDFSYCETIIEKIMEIPINHFSHSKHYESITQFFIHYTELSVLYDTIVNGKFFELFRVMNNKILLLEKNTETFIFIHSYIFNLSLVLFEKRKITISKKGQLYPHMKMLKDCSQMIVQEDKIGPELIDLINKELFVFFSHLLKPMAKVSDPSLLAYMNFIINLIFKKEASLFEKIYKCTPHATEGLFFGFLSTIKVFYGKIIDKKRALPYLKEVMSITARINEAKITFSEEATMGFLVILFQIVSPLEKTDPDMPLHLSYLDEILALQPTTSKIALQKEELIFKCLLHYVVLCQMDRRRSYIEETIFPKIIKAFQQLPKSDSHHYKNIEKIIADNKI